MINQPWDPKRPLEGPQGQVQLRCVLPDGAGPSAPRGDTRRGAAARRPLGTRAAGSWRCSALPRTSAARRAGAPHCAAHGSRVSEWGCQAGGGRRHRGGGCGNSSLEGRETGAEGGGRQFRSAKGWTEVSVAKEGDSVHSVASASGFGSPRGGTLLSAAPPRGSPPY